MNETKIAILSTRPLTNDTMLKAADSNVTIDTESFIQTNSIVDQNIAEEIRKYATEDISAVFTSMNAAEAVIDCLELDGIIPDWTIYSMGGITQTIIKNYFLDSEIIATASNSTQLAETIVEDEVDEVVFFCGNQRREELPSLLSQRNVQVNEVVVYETLEIPVKITKKYRGILFFSPSAVRSFFSINNIDGDAVLFAIGTTTADALKKASSNKIIVGEFPNKEQLAEKAIAYFTKSTE